MRYIFIIISIIALIFYYHDFREQRAEAVFFNVGQGDSFLLHTPGGLNVLIDGGPDWSALYGLGRYLKHYGEKIDLMILSHGHSDHLSALPELAARYRVDNVFLPAGLSGYEAEALLSALAGQGSSVFYPQSYSCFDLEDSCRLCLYPPEKKFLKSDDANDFSLAFDFVCAGFSLAGAGDASGEREKDLLSRGFPPPVQVLKASHHGSANANSDGFVDSANPLALIISVGPNNYGHPNPKLINSAVAKGVYTWRTDQQGDVLFYANNNKLYIEKPW